MIRIQYILRARGCNNNGRERLVARRWIGGLFFCPHPSAHANSRAQKQKVRLDASITRSGSSWGFMKPLSWLSMAPMRVGVEEEEEEEEGIYDFPYTTTT